MYNRKFRLQRDPDMHDMLVKLYNIPDDCGVMQKARDTDIIIRKPIGPERHLVVDWVQKKFNKAWSSETDMAFANRPLSCFIALKGRKLAGFACYDATALGYFGPTGVESAFRNKGIGTALLFACMQDMRLKGYGYAIIGGVGPAEYYRKTVGATDIPESTPGIWKTWLRE
jgi:GNAT superfamily N-acetyltransferase